LKILFIDKFLTCKNVKQKLEEIFFQAKLQAKAFF